MSWTGPRFLVKLTRYGKWTGPGWAAGRDSPPGDPITANDLLVAGVDAFDDLVSKPHDIAYDRAQVRFLKDFADPTIDKFTPLSAYFSALAAADRRFLREAKKPENLAAKKGRQIQINAVDLFRVKSAWEETRASECARGWGPHYADQIKPWSRRKILEDLDWPKKTIPPEVPNITT